MITGWECINERLIIIYQTIFEKVITSLEAMPPRNHMMK